MDWLSESSVVPVEGLGDIAQYDSHLRGMPHNGIQYFVRDYLTGQVAQRPELQVQLDALNSELIMYEISLGLDTWRKRHQSGPTTTSRTTSPGK